MPSFKLGKRSRAELVGVHPKLVEFVIVGMTDPDCPIDFVVFDGLRTMAEQKRHVANGKSFTMNSKHLTGHAVDLVPFIGNQIVWSWPPFYPLAAHLKRIAKRLGLTVEWGGDWKKPDGPHWQIDPRKYPMPT